MFEQRVNSDVLTVSTVNSQDQVTQKPLRDSVKQALKNYFAQLNGQDVNDLYELVLAEVEQPLLDMVMQYTRGNQTRAALMAFFIVRTGNRQCFVNLLFPHFSTPAFRVYFQQLTGSLFTE
ncbi:MAG: DNA-binding transcriptional regulator Fis [Enterobacter hormaechei]|nr:DNA-binding transcriptional regulator Fis [Enterobacter hormaechei]